MMKIVDRHLMGAFLRGFGLVTLVLLSLFSLLALVRELDDVGQGAYRLRDAFLYVALTLPRLAHDLSPVCALLGSLIGLGVLADGHELVALRAAGVSPPRICLSVLAGGALVMAGAVLCAQFVAPLLEQRARTRRALALADAGVLTTKGGFWARDGNRLVLVRRMGEGGEPAEVDLYERGEDGLLRSLVRAEGADIAPGGLWRLRGVEARDVQGDGTVTSRPAEEQGDAEFRFLTPEQAAVLGVPPETHSLSDLRSYVRALEGRGENAEAYALALWQKGAMPLATAAMVLVSVPMLFGLTRGRHAGTRVLLGSVVGVAFHLANQVGGQWALIADIPPQVPALVPSAAVIAAAAWRIRDIS